MTKSVTNQGKNGTDNFSSHDTHSRHSENPAAASISKPGKLDKAVRELFGEDKPHRD